jgi:tripeptide aminopeptidase
MNIDRLITTFCELVKIPSESPEDREFVAYMEELLKKEGAKTQKDDYGNLIAKFPAKNSSKTEPIAFCCHADTVKPGLNIEPVIDKDKGLISSKCETILGADDKAGIAAVIEMIRSVEKAPPIEVIITRCEESGTLGSSNMNYKLIDSKMAYVLDEELVNEIIIGAPTKIAMYLEFKGKSAHASEPENGISSIKAAADAVVKLKLGRLDEGSTANVGVIEGGEVTNGIPEKTKLIAECRSTDNEKAFEIEKQMKDVFNQAAKANGASVDIKSELKYSAFKIAEDSKVVKIAIEALQKNGVKDIRTKVITGGLDANNLNANGIETATLGVGYREIHTTEEYLIINEFETSTKTIIDIVHSLA